jgi:pilus assembly protein Flp/PilA
MKIRKGSKENSRQSGQGLVEYALILVLVAAIVTAVLIFIGPRVGNTFSKVGSLSTPAMSTQATTPTPQCSTAGVPGIVADMEQRSLNYYNQYFTRV